MGGTTPVYSWPYPYDTEVYNASTVQTLMTDIDTTLGTVATEQTNLLHDQTLLVGVSSVQTITLATSTTLIFNCDGGGVWNPDGIVTDPFSSHSTGIINVGTGLWHMQAQLYGVASGSLPTSLRFSVLQNGAGYARSTMCPPPTDALDAQFYLTCVGMPYFSVAGTVGLAFLYNGGPATMTVAFGLQLRKIRSP